MRGLNEFIKAVRNAKVRERAVAGIANALPHTLGRGALPGCADRRRRARAFQRVRGLGTPGNLREERVPTVGEGCPRCLAQRPPPQRLSRSLSRARARSQLFAAVSGRR